MTTGFAPRPRRARIEVHWTWVATVVVLALALGLRRVPLLCPEWTATATWATAIGTAVLVGVSLVAHEAGHAVTARRFGAGEIVLRFALAGSAVTTDARFLGPRGVALTGIAGPAVNLAVTVTAWATAHLLDPSITTGGLLFGSPTVHGEGDATVATAMAIALADTATINGLAGLINLLPVPPFDGSYVIEAVVWRLTGRLETALRTSRALARVLGATILGGGIALLIAGDFANGALAVILGLTVDRLQGIARRL